MDSIDRLNRAVEVLRRELAERAERLDTGKPGAPTPPRARPAGRPTVPELRQRVVERLRQLDPHDPRRDQRARRVFLESVLVWEFGEQVLNDRRFDELVSGVQQALASHPETDRQLGELIDSLRNA